MNCFSNEYISHKYKLVSENFPNTFEKRFGGLTLDYKNVKTTNSLSLGLSTIENIYFPNIRNEIPFGGEFNINLSGFDFDWLNNDPYNNGKRNYSYLQNLSVPWIYVVVGINGLFTDSGSGDSSPLFYPMLAIALAPRILSGAQISYSFLQKRTYDYNYLTTSLCINTELDYFNSNAVKFFRYKPSFGLEFGHVFVHNENTIATLNGLYFHIGAEYLIDFLINKKSRTSGFVPSLGIRFAYGLSFK